MLLGMLWCVQIILVSSWYWKQVKNFFYKFHLNFSKQKHCHLIQKTQISILNCEADVLWHNSNVWNAIPTVNFTQLISLQRLKKEFDATSKQLAAKQKEYEAEVLRKVELENTVKTLREEQAFLKQLHQQVWFDCIVLYYKLGIFVSCLSEKIHFNYWL